MFDLTIENVESLAPQPSILVSARGLATPERWHVCFRDDRALWGAIQGSGSLRYQVMVDLVGPAFKCNCPSRVFPCKHALALLVMACAGPTAVPFKERPDVVNEWITKRGDTTSSPKKPSKTAPAPNDESVPDESAFPISINRLERMRTGMEDLSLWLEDMVRRGLLETRDRNAEFWESATRRLIDAQSPGAARWVTDLSSTIHLAEEWRERSLECIAQLSLMTSAFRRIDQLTPDWVHTVLTAAGVSQKLEDLRAQPENVGSWFVAGNRVIEEDRINTHRTWLFSQKTGCPALLLQFLRPGQEAEAPPTPGLTVTGDIRFYPGSLPLRGGIVRSSAEPGPGPLPPSSQGVAAALNTWSDALAFNPWLTVWPLSITGVVPEWTGIRGRLRDSSGEFLPILPGFPDVWRLIAVGGGRLVTVYGEWNGWEFLPLSVVAEGRFHRLNGRLV